MLQGYTVNQGAVDVSNNKRYLYNLRCLFAKLPSRGDSGRLASLEHRVHLRQTRKVRGVCGRRCSQMCRSLSERGVHRLGYALHQGVE